MPLLSNKGKSFQGSIVLGKGFVLSIEEAEKLIEKDPRNKDVIFPYLNGDDLNNDPEQKPSRWVINFFDWDEAKAKTYPDCYEIIEKSVKPERQRWKIDNDGNEIVGTYALRKPLPQKWWIYGEKRPALYNAISELDQVMVINNHTRHHVLAFYSERIVYSHALTVIAIDSLSYYSIMTSQIMNEWAWHKGSTMGTSTLRYTSSQIFETFPFPTNITEIEKDLLEGLGKNYLALQKNIMDSLNLGITKTYNLFHNKDLSYLDLEKQLNEDKNICIGIYNDILKLRDLQIDIDEAVLNLFEWSEIELNHGFYELEYLPENDRVRFSIHPTARKEILKRLLLLNLEQSKSDILDNNIVKKKLRVVSKTSTNSLFPED
ncbi:DNA methyltransferase family protein [Elizabethkingia miricola]